MKNRYAVHKDSKKLIVNEQEGDYNIIVLSDEKSTDEHGEYIKLSKTELTKLYNAIGEMI